MPNQSKYAVASSHAAIVPSDATILEGVKAIICLTAGNLVAQGAEAVSITYPMTPMQRLDLSVRKVMAASTGTYAQLR